MTRTSTTLGVLLVCLLGLFLRWRGLGFLLPHYTPSDELVIDDQVDHLRRGLPPPRLDGTVMPTYPLLLAYAAAPLHASPRPERAQTLDQHVAMSSALRLDVRVALMLISLLVLPGTWLLARHFLDPPWALFAAALVATSFLSLSNAQMGRPHAPVTALSLLAVVASLRLVRRPTVGGHVLAGVAAALAVGCLHNGAAVLLPLAVALAASWRRPGRASRWWILAPALLVLVAVRLFYPFHFENWTDRQGPAADREGVFNVSGHLLRAGDFDGSGLLHLIATFYSYDPLILLLAVIGAGAVLVGWARGRFPVEEGRAELFVVLSYALPYLLLLGLYARTAERFVLPVLPYVACAAACGAAWITRPLGRARAAGALALLALPAWAAYHVGTVRAARDTSAEAADWVREHVDPDGSRLFVLPFLTLPLPYGEEALAFNWANSQKTQWLEYLYRLEPGAITGPRWNVFHPRKVGTDEALLGDPLGWLRSERIDYVVIQHVRPSFRSQSLPQTRAALLARAERVARLSPMRNDDGEPARLDYNYSRPVLERPFVWHMLQARCMGPTLEIYRVTNP